MSTEAELLAQIDVVVAGAGVQTWDAMRSGLDFSRSVLLPAGRGYSIVIMPASVQRPTSNEKGGSSCRITWAYRLDFAEVERSAFTAKLAPAVRQLLLASTWTALSTVFAVDMPDTIEVDRSGNVILASGDWLVALT